MGFDAPERRALSSDAGSPTDEPGGLRIEIHDDPAAIETVWRTFEAQADGTVFQSYEWLSVWHRQIGTRLAVQPLVVTGSDGRGLVFLLPLMVASDRASRRLSFLGSDLCDYNAPLLASDAVERLGAPFAEIWQDVLTRLRRRAPFDMVVLTKMPEHVGEQPNPLLQLATTTGASGAYAAKLDGDWDRFYERKRTAATRSRDRGKQKKLAGIGEVAFVTPDRPEDVLRSLDELFQQKGRNFARMGVANVLASPGWAEFFRDLATDPASRGIVHVSRLDVGSTCVAVNLGLIHRRRYYHVLSSYDIASPAARFGAGGFHLHEMMRYAIKHGCAEFDFTIGDEPYKRDWSDTEQLLREHMKAVTWRGRLALLPTKAAAFAKRWIKQTPWAWAAFQQVRSRWAKLRLRLGSRSG